MTVTKTNPGNYFEDFRLGQEIRHRTRLAVPVGEQQSGCAVGNILQCSFRARQAAHLRDGGASQRGTNLHGCRCVETDQRHGISRGEGHNSHVRHQKFQHRRCYAVNR